VSKPKSNSLFHFTKDLGALKSILLNGYAPRYCLEEKALPGQNEGIFVAFPIVSFCDIPLRRIDEHVEFYGAFGLGMKKSWALENGLNPILYLAETSPLAEAIAQFKNAAVGMDEKHANPSYLEHARCTIAFMRPLVGFITRDGVPIAEDKEFYQESEWRYLARRADISEWLSQDEFDDKARLEAANKLAAERAALRFSPKDVRHLFVASDSDIPDLVDFINRRTDRSSSTDRTLLVTKITSLESIRMDM